MKSGAGVPEAVTALDDAAGALQDFEQMDKRARDHVHGGQLALASDLVFADGFDLTKKAGTAVDRALTAELLARDAVIGGLRRKEAIALAGASLAALLALVLLVPIPITPRYRKDDVLAGLAVLTAKPAPVATRAQEPPRVKEKEIDLADLALVTAPKPARPPEPRVDLGGVAALCVDLARIQDTQALPGLLARTADVLQASGIVLWIADPDGRELSPIVVHGYPPQLATRFGTILRDAENVTASAFRTGLLQTMKGDAISNGAVAAPLVSSGGCVGVMAAEMKNGGEQQESLLAAATIVASQLATLVGPPSTSSRTKTEAVSKQALGFGL
jgi:hypothetical protein